MCHDSLFLCMTWYFGVLGFWHLKIANSPKLCGLILDKQDFLQLGSLEILETSQAFTGHESSLGL